METQDCGANHSKHITSCWNQNVEEVPDFIIEIEDIRIPCHKNILRKASSYFEALFLSRMKESELNHVTLEDTDKKTFMSLLKFAYEGKLDICEETMFFVTAMANMYQFESALKHAEKFLASRVATKTWCEILQFADTHQLKEAYHVSLRYILWYFPEEMKRNVEDFQQLPQNLLCKVLGHELLNCDSESQVLKILISWSDGHGISSSSKEFTELVSAVIHLNNLHSEEIRGINLECVLQDIKEKQIMKKMQDNMVTSGGTQQTSCQSRKGPLVMLCVGGDASIEESSIFPSKYIYQVDPFTGGIQQYESLDQVFPTQGTNMGYRACSVDKDLYITGGEARLGRNTWQTDVWKFSSFTNTWSVITTLLQPRRHHGICVLDGDIYLIGGIGKFRQVLTSVEKYNPGTDEWMQLAPLLQSEFWPAAVACRGDVYVMKNCIQKYSPQRDQWTKLTVELPINLGYYSAVSVRDVIYMKCQYDGHLVKLQTDSKHTVAEVVAEFSESPSGQLLYFQGRIYCLELTSGSKSQYYDFRTQKVVTIGAPDVALSGYSVVLLPSFPTCL